MDHPFSRARQRQAGARQRGHHASAPPRIQSRRARQGSPAPAQPPLHERPTLRSNREPAAIGQLLAVRADRAGAGRGAEERLHHCQRVLLGNLSVFLRPAGKGARGAASRPSDHGPQTAAGRRDPAPGSPAGGDGRRRRRRMGVGVQPDRKVRAGAVAPHARNGERQRHRGAPRRPARATGAGHTGAPAQPGEVRRHSRSGDARRGAYPGRSPGKPAVGGAGRQAHAVAHRVCRAVYWFPRQRMAGGDQQSVAAVLSGLRTASQRDHQRGGALQPPPSQPAAAAPAGAGARVVEEGLRGGFLGGRRPQ